MILNAVYYAEAYGCVINPIAIRPNFKENQCTWEDTSDRVHTTTLKKILGITQSESTPIEWQQCPTRVDMWLQGEKPTKKISFTLLTLQIYNDKVRDLVAGNLKFKSDDEVQSYFLTTNFSRF